MNIQEFISSLPQSLVKNEDISIPNDVIRKLFRLADLCKTDVFFAVGCGNNNAVKIAAKEFKVKRSVGIEIRKTLADKARKKIISMKKVINDIWICGNAWHGIHGATTRSATTAIRYHYKYRWTK